MCLLDTVSCTLAMIVDLNAVFNPIVECTFYDCPSPPPPPPDNAINATIKNTHQYLIHPHHISTHCDSSNTALYDITTALRMLTFGIMSSRRPPLNCSHLGSQQLVYSAPGSHPRQGRPARRPGYPTPCAMLSMMMTVRYGRYHLRD